MERIEVSLDDCDLAELRDIVSQARFLVDKTDLFSLGGSLAIHDSNGNYIGLLSFDTKAPSLLF
jgi:hypothetical protein